MTSDSTERLLRDCDQEVFGFPRANATKKLQLYYEIRMAYLQGGPRISQLVFIRTSSNLHQIL